MKVMIGCMTESTVGISAIAQFLPLLDYVDMDGAVLIAKDVASRVVPGPCGIATENGKARLLRDRRPENGKGVRHASMTPSRLSPDYAHAVQTLRVRTAVPTRSTCGRRRRTASAAPPGAGG